MVSLAVKCVVMAVLEGGRGPDCRSSVAPCLLRWQPVLRHREGCTMKTSWLSLLQSFSIRSSMRRSEAETKRMVLAQLLRGPCLALSPPPPHPCPGLSVPSPMPPGRLHRPINQTCPWRPLTRTRWLYNQRSKLSFQQCLTLPCPARGLGAHLDSCPVNHYQLVTQQLGAMTSQRCLGTLLETFC